VVFKLNPDTVDELDLNKYVGLWYQMEADAIVMETFEKDSYCSTALYGLNADNTVSVHNYATIGAPNGTTYVIDGYAYGSNPDEPGQLKVHFDSDDAAPFDAPYWVLALGPVNADNLYDWAIVSDNFSAFLFVLARDVNTYNTVYKSDIMAMLTDLGFTGRTAPIDTYQGSDCVYEAAK
jgi:lipocalin